MANFEDGSYSSMPGIALIAKVLAGRCLMRYTRAAVGKGNIPDGMSPKTMTEPADYVMDAKIAAVTTPVDGECQVTVQINSSDVETGFYATGVLLYAEDPDEGEVPYTYLVLENGPEWIRPASSVVGKLATFDLIAAVGDVDTVTATIDPDSIVTHAAVEQLIREHNADAAAHPAILAAMAEIAASATIKLDITIPAEGWTEDEDTDGIFGMHVDIPNEAITEEMLPILTILPAYYELAKASTLCGASRTIPGALRVYAQSAPAADIGATLALIGGTGTGTTGGGGSGTYVLPVATANTLGGVKIGEGLNIASDGTISINEASLLDEDTVATEEDTEEMLNNVFDNSETGGNSSES